MRQWWIYYNLCLWLPGISTWMDTTLFGVWICPSKCRNSTAMISAYVHHKKYPASCSAPHHLFVASQLCRVDQWKSVTTRQSCRRCGLARFGSWFTESFRTPNMLSYRRSLYSKSLPRRTGADICQCLFTSDYFLHDFLWYLAASLSFGRDFGDGFITSSYLDLTASRTWSELIYHWRRYLSGFATHLSKGVNSNDADAMLATATLINGVAFALVDPHPRPQVLSLTSRSCDLSWLYVQKGISTVYQALPFIRCESALKRFFDDMGEDDDIQKPTSSDNVSQFQRLADLCVTTDLEKNLYHDTLQILATLLQLECFPDTILMHLGFIGSMSNDFIDLLRIRDHRALLIMSYWYANICSFDCW